MDEAEISALSAKFKRLLFQKHRTSHRTSAAEQQNRQSFVQRLRSHQHQVQQYESIDAQDKALAVIPVDRLHDEARALKDSETQLSFEDLVLKRLLHWFKHDFFKWTNQPPCPSGCTGSTVPVGGSAPTPEEQRYGAGTVEVYKCPNCARSIRFPRYNDAVKLFETRNGRCGEWANCFTLLCRAMGYDARLVVDWTDHVWTEVFSDHLQRWIHLDSCEAGLSISLIILKQLAFDSPLMYESGWGKKLTYIIAFSVDEVVDVTLRYTQKSSEVFSRRRLVSETWLAETFDGLNAEKSGVFSDARKANLASRLLKERASFITGVQRVLNDQELIGRQSGALEWRLQRGEVGSIDGAATTVSTLPEESRLVRILSHKSPVSTYRNAKVMRNNNPAWIQLTADQRDQLGAVWFNQPLPFNEHGFLVEFEFSMAKSGADGMALVLQNADTNFIPLGAGGCDLGYGGIPNSIAIELDTFHSPEYHDPSDNHISVQTRNTEPNCADHVYSLGSTNAIPFMSNETRYAIAVLYDCKDKLMSIFMTKSIAKNENGLRGKDYHHVLTIERLELALRLPSLRHLRVGFTASTGGVNQHHFLHHAQAFILKQ